ncbi:MAG: ABC transporter permease [candidate division Zixibacteria bacterium]|nr:ABC transporter permease [candidate division Zixibacteria bacterium]
MQLLDSTIQALASLKANKLRSVLTLVGVIIGVMTVIAVASIISGMNKHVSDQLSRLGPTTFIIDKYGIITSDEEWYRAMRRKDLTVADADAIRDYCTECDGVGTLAETRGKIKYGREFVSDIEIKGVSSNIESIMSIFTEFGYSPTEFDIQHRNQVALIGWAVADKLFPVVDPIGKRITVGSNSFTVVGVAEKRGSFLGQSQDNFVMIPITTYQKLFQSKRFDWFGIVVKAKSFQTMEEAKDEARLVLRARRHVPYKEDDDFGIFSADTLMDFWRAFTSTAFLVMIGVSSIALLVGGVVIMNIMFVSVKERTREIGIRKAVGARKRSILWQFLIEATTISLVGGLLGVLVGAGIAKLVHAFTPLPASVELWSVVSGLLIAGFVGLFFGIYPAMKAAQLDPIEALRYE